MMGTSPKGAAALWADLGLQPAAPCQQQHTWDTALGCNHLYRQTRARVANSTAGAWVGGVGACGWFGAVCDAPGPRSCTPVHAVAWSVVRAYTRLDTRAWGVARHHAGRHGGSFVQKAVESVGALGGGRN